MYKVKIKDYEYEIIEMDSFDNEILSEGETIYWGRQMSAELKIYVYNNDGVERLKAILIYELTHAFIDAYVPVAAHDFSEEELCMFMGAYAAEIIGITNDYMNQR